MTDAEKAAMNEAYDHAADVARRVLRNAARTPGNAGFYPEGLTLATEVEDAIKLLKR
jgi:hypothetical protein